MLNNHEWAVCGAYGVCVLTEDENGEFSFGGEKKWKTENLFPKRVYPLGDKAMLVAEGGIMLLVCCLETRTTIISEKLILQYVGYAFMT